MLQHAPKVGFLVAVACFLAQGRFDAQSERASACAGGMGAGCGGGIGYSGGGNTGGYGFGGYTGCGGYGGGLPASLSARYSYPIPLDSPRLLVSGSQSQRPDLTTNSVLLTVDVPADAKVFINGRPTESTGPRRAYISMGLKPDVVYAYRVRAEFVLGGNLVRLERTIPLIVGNSASLDFTTASALQLVEAGKDALQDP